MEPAGALLAPLALLAAVLWNFAVLASVQLTVRLIRAFAFRRTCLAACALTLATVPLTILYRVVLDRGLGWLPAMVAVTAVVGYVVALRLLRFRRRRSAVVAALGIGLLSAPWGAFLVR